MYEMVWFHLVQLVVGASSISVAVLLCSFMGGMALGSWLLPRLAPANADPLRVIAGLEAGIAAFGVLIPLALPYVQQAYLSIVGYGFGAVLLRAAVCTLVLTPPTMLMGATLPIVARLPTANVGRLYTANLVGGAIGTALAGFYLLRVFDVYVASGVAIAINVVVAAAAWAFSRRIIATHGEQLIVKSQVPLALYAAAALSGFTALGAEVVWTRQLSLLFGASVYTFSLILAVFLAGLAIGGSIGARLARRTSVPAIALGRVQLALALAIAAGAWLIVNALPQWQPTRSFLPAIHASPGFTFGFDALRCAVAMLPATILWGASFPLTIAAAKGSVASINALNTAGALAGAILVTLVAIPSFGSQRAQQLLVLLAALSSVIILKRISALSVASVVAFISVFSVPDVPGRLIAYG